LLLLWVVVITFSWAYRQRMPSRCLCISRAKKDKSPFILPPANPGKSPCRNEVMTPTGVPLPAPKILGAEPEPPARKADGKRKKKMEGPEIHGTPHKATAPPTRSIAAGLAPGVAAAHGDQILEQGSEQYFSEDLVRKQSRIIEETLLSLGAAGARPGD
jgi:hypothetical protein